MNSDWKLEPYLRVKSAPEAISFYRDVFGAVEGDRFDMPDGKVGYAQLNIHGCSLCLADADFDDERHAIRPHDTATISFLLTLSKIDDVFAAAIMHGAKSLKPLYDTEFGTRGGSFIDPFGNCWTLQTPVQS